MPLLSQAPMDSSTPFTASQWQELHCQAMIFKHLVAGQPVPPELVMPIKRSFEAVVSTFCHQTPFAYYPYFGKKLDTEPGRCRRTDGKKWRCSKDAHPDSKYCERHMNRGRSRSRKPVETKTTTQMQTSPSPASSSLTNVTSTESSGSKAIDSFGSSCQTGVLPHFITNVQLQGSYSGTKISQLQRDPGSYLARGNNDYSRLEGTKFDMNQHSIPFDAVEGVKGFDIDFSLGNSWNLMAPGVSSLSTPKDRNEPDLPSSYTEFQSSQDQQEQHCFFGNDFGSLEPLKQNTRSLRPFFDEWPKTRNSWFGIDGDQCDKNAFNTTQLSMSTPMSSSGFSTTASRSPVDG